MSKNIRLDEEQQSLFFQRFNEVDEPSFDKITLGEKTERLKKPILSLSGSTPLFWIRIQPVRTGSNWFWLATRSTIRTKRELGTFSRGNLQSLFLLKTCGETKKIDILKTVSIRGTSNKTLSRISGCGIWRDRLEQPRYYTRVEKFLWVKHASLLSHDVAFEGFVTLTTTEALFI